jgi:hypothetical protein
MFRKGMGMEQNEIVKIASDYNVVISSASPDLSVEDGCCTSQIAVLPHCEKGNVRQRLRLARVVIKHRATAALMGSSLKDFPYVFGGI